MVPGGVHVATLDELTDHCRDVARVLLAGAVVPFLGAGANLCERPIEGRWQDGYLPSGRELAAHLAELYGYPESELDLLRVSQWVDLKVSEQRLVDELHTVFAGDYRPNKLHRFLAGLPRTLRERGASSCGQILLTTNYDDMLERAFAEAGESADVVVYEMRGSRQRFVHQRPDGERVIVDDAPRYRDFALEHRSVILKIHGDVDPEEPGRDTFVVTEDNYIDYMAGVRVYDLIPTYLTERVGRSELLFLGYSMRDWNLRVILRQIWAEQAFRTAGWSIQRGPSEVDRRFWERQRIRILDVALEDWVDAMVEQVDALRESPA
jgi:SIR2-like domain